jgi:hypothetical protein
MKPHQQSEHQVGSTPPETDRIDRVVLAVCGAALLIAVIVGLTSTAPTSPSCAAPGQVANQK